MSFQHSLKSISPNGGMTSDALNFIRSGQHSLKSISPNGGHPPTPESIQTLEPTLAEINITEWRTQHHIGPVELEVQHSLKSISPNGEKASWRQLCDEQ